METTYLLILIIGWIVILSILLFVVLIWIQSIDTKKELIKLRELEKEFKNGFSNMDKHMQNIDQKLSDLSSQNKLILSTIEFLHRQLNTTNTDIKTAKEEIKEEQKQVLKAITEPLKINLNSND